MGNTPRASELSPKTIILVRHAHRDRSEDYEEDNGISEKGTEQAKRIANYFKKRIDTSADCVIYSSPKKRCLETIERVARDRKIKIQTSPSLDEGGDPLIKAKAFSREIQSTKGSLIVACSHGDIIPKIFKELIQCEIHLSKGGIAQIEGTLGHLDLQWLLQEL